MGMTQDHGIHSLHQTKLLVSLMHHTAYARPMAGILPSLFLALFTASLCAGAHIVEIKSK